MYTINNYPFRFYMMDKGCSYYRVKRRELISRSCQFVETVKRGGLNSNDNFSPFSKTMTDVRWNSHKLFN